MPTNFYMFFVAGLIPMIIGAIYYHPKVAGNAWMKTNGFTTESLEGGNMALIFGLSYVLSVLLSFYMASLVIHQGGVFSMLMPAVMESGSTEMLLFNDLMSKYGDTGRTFGHGALHGVLTSIFLILPIIAIISLFERRGGKYILIHWIYWAVCLALIGGLICATLQYAPMQ